MSNNQSLNTANAAEQDYVARINRELLPSKNTKFDMLDLFAGCGGLSLGFESVGFRSLGFEQDRKCCDTYNANLNGSCVVKTITSRTNFPEADVVIGGPPCQPFSVFGNQNGASDKRNGIPAFISAIRKTSPKIWMFENVRGMLYKSKDYFESSLKMLKGLGYDVEYRMLNAADYGVPQNRLRVVVVGHHGGFEFPEGEKTTVPAGAAVGDTAHTFDSDSKILTPSMDRYIAIYEKKSQLVNPRDMNLGKPARTITCRNLAGATSDMQRIVLPDGRRRRLTVSEGARLQSFPDWFAFAGTETDRFNQIGNAVPPLFARAIAKQIKKYLDRF